MNGGAESFQAQLAFTTTGVTQPTVQRNSRCLVSRIAPGQFLVQALEDIAAQSCDYSLASSLDVAAVPVIVNIRKLAAFTWLLTTGQVAGGVGLEQPSWKGSAFLSTANGAAASGFIADGNLAVTVKAPSYPMPVATSTLKLSIFVLQNSLSAGAGPATGITSFIVVKNGVDTADKIDVNPLATGLFTASFVIAYAAGDTFDLRAAMPGSGDGPQTIQFGATMDFASAAASPAQLAIVDTTGAQINLTLRRVDPM